MGMFLNMAPNTTDLVLGLHFSVMLMFVRDCLLSNSSRCSRGLQACQSESNNRALVQTTWDHSRGPPWLSLDSEGISCGCHCEMGRSNRSIHTASLQKINLENWAQPLDKLNFQRAFCGEREQWFWDSRPSIWNFANWNYENWTYRAVLPFVDGSELFLPKARELAKIFAAAQALASMESLPNEASGARRANGRVYYVIGYCYTILLYYTILYYIIFHYSIV